MYCTNCGQELPNDAVFCTKCGTKVTDSTAKSISKVPDRTPPIFQQNNLGTNFNKNLIGKIILFLIVVGGLFAFMYYSPIKAGDYFARIKFFRGEPVKVEKNLVVFQKEPLLVVDLYEYPDVVIVTEPADDSKGLNRVYGFVPVGKYEILDLTDMYKSILKGYGVNEEDDKLRMVMFSQQVQQNKEIPLKIKSEEIITESKSDTIKKDSSETVKQPEVVQKPSNSGGMGFVPHGTLNYRITGTDVNMRSGPGKNYDVIDVFDKGEIVTGFDNEISKTAAWVKVKRSNGKVGWVSKDYCKLINNTNTNNQSNSGAVGNSNYGTFVGHWNYENIDIYVDNKSITSGTSASGKYFKVKVNQVQNGNVIKSVKYSFSQYYTDAWRYKTDEMKGNTSIVSNNKVFEHCMKQLGWSYKKDGMYYK